MINDVIWKDTIFSGTEDYLEYRISKNVVTPVYYGKAFRSPSSGRYEINISDKARSFLKPHISSSAWTTVDGVYETEDFAATFAIQDLANSAVSLEQFYLQYTTAEDFIGGAKISARPINGHIDPRMKMMWAKWDYMTRNVPVDKGYKYFDINIVSGSLDYEFSGGTNTVVFEATGPEYTIYTDDEWLHITGGDGTYEITTDINTGETRTGYVCAQWRNAQFQLEEKCFEVTQNEEVFEFTYQGNTAFSYTGGTNVLSFTANTEIEIIYAPTWITSATVSGSETGTITLTATGNTFDARIGTIKVRRKNYPSGKTAEIVVTQERVQLELTFSGDTVFEYSGGTINVAYTANTQFQTLAIPVWVNSVQIPSTLTGNIQITAAPNEGEQRTGSIIFYDGVDSSRTVSLEISQKKDIPVYEKKYLTIEALSAGTLILAGTMSGTPGSGYIYYSVNSGTWKAVSLKNSEENISVSSGDIIRFKGTNNFYYQDFSCYFDICPSYECNVYGNILSLIYGDSFSGHTELPTSENTFRYLFGSYWGNPSKIVSAKNLKLPSNTMPYCYCNMFVESHLLTEAPELPATIMTKGCYELMFGNCTSLRTAPELPATTLADYCYWCMFKGCTSLVNAPVLPARTLAKNCYDGMFYSCTSLTTAPVLPATTLADGCYDGMFSKCASLNYIKCLLTNYNASNCKEWVNGVSSTGTFVKKAGVAWPSGISGIPNGWTVQEE